MSGQRLSRQDQRFLRHEAVSPMNIGALTVFAPGALGRVPDFAAVRTAISDRLHRVPRLGERLERRRIGRGRWVAVDRVDLDHHIRRIELPGPVSRAALDRFAADAVAERFDFDRPLWKVWFVEGLEGGGVAIVFVVNHASMDGAAGFFVLTQILGAAYATEDLAAVDAYEASKAPPVTWRAAVRREATSLTHLLGCGPPPRSSFLNGEVGPRRTIRGFRIPLAAIREVRRELGGTPTDVLLACVTDAMRAAKRRRGSITPGLDIRAAVPANVRKFADLPRLGNQVVGFQVSLPIDKATSIGRLAQISSSMRAWKATRDSWIARLLTQLFEGLWSRAVAWRIPVLRRLTLSHLIVSTCPPIPGSYDLLGAPLREVRPILPLFAEQGLAIGAVAFEDDLHVGFTADPEIVPDADELVADVRRAIAELRGWVASKARTIEIEVPEAA